MTEIPSGPSPAKAERGRRLCRVFPAAWTCLFLLAVLGGLPLRAEELLRETLSREFTLLVGGSPDYPEAISREFTLLVGADSARPYGEVISREVSLLVPTTAVPPALTGFDVQVSPTGETAMLDWSNYDELQQRDIVNYRIYRSNAPFASIVGLTPVATVPAGAFTQTFTGLPAYQDQYFAVVPVDALGGFETTVNYAASYVLSPEVISREFTLMVGGAPDYPEAISHELSLVVGTTAAPAAITGLSVRATPDGRAATLDWSTYPELSERDILRYDVYVSDHEISQVSGLTPSRSVSAGTFTTTIDGLSAGNDHYFAVVPVDVLGNSITAVNYAIAAVLMPEIISREFTLMVGGAPEYPEAISRELSLLAPTPEVPAPVTGLNSGFVANTSVSAYRAVDLAWPAYDELAQVDVVRYRIYVGGVFFETVSSMEPFALVSAGTLRTTVTGLASRGIYYFAVVAEDAGGRFNSVVRSVSAQATPEGVGEVRDLAVAVEADALSFTWAPPADGGAFLTGYRLRFGVATEPINVSPDVTSRRFTGLLPARGYNLRVSTVDIFGNESAGAFLLGATFLPNPADVAATGLDSRVLITWSAAAPAELVARYAIYLSTSPITSVTGLTPALEVTGTSAIIPNLTNGTTYHFAVATVNVAGGIASAVASVPAAPVLDFAGPRLLETTPTGTFSAAGFAFIDVRFSEAIDAASFSATDATFTGPLGVVPIQTVTTLDGRSFRLAFANQTFSGAYALRVGPQVTDLSGNPMNQDGDATNGEPLADVFETSLTFQGTAVADLTVENVVVSGTGLPGSTATASWRIRNGGDAPAGAPWLDQVSLATDGTTANPLPVGTALYSGSALAPRATLERTLDFVVPLAGPTGAVRVLVRTDADAQVAELNEANNTALSAGTLVIPTRLALALSKSEISEADGPSAATGTVQRNGDLSVSLVVTLATNDITSATVSGSVVIPAGQASASFPVAAVADDVVDGAKTVQFTASATGFPLATANLVVLDANRHSLTVSTSETIVLEGDRFTVTVARAGPSAGELAVRLSSTNPGALTVPASVTIPAGAVSAEFTVVAPQNFVVETDRAATLRAEADGLGAGALTFTVVDDDMPFITLALDQSVIGEADGASATTGLVTRDTAPVGALTVTLTNDAPDVVTVPASVTIAAGQRAARFNIGAVNNLVADPDRVATIGARVVVGGTTVAEAEPVTLSVLDDDGPRLSLEIPVDVVGEGLTPATTATLRRPAAGPNALEVAVTSSAPAAATSPTSVTIPANATAVTFSIDTAVSPAADGSRLVTFRASATGLAASEATVIVSDEIKPDLRIIELELPTGILLTEVYTNVVFRIANDGLAPAQATAALPWKDRVYLSKTGSLADAVLVAEQVYTDSLPPGLDYERSVPIRTPREVGDYYVLVETNADRAVAEITRANNLRVSTVPLHIGAGYSATVQANIEQGPAGVPVIFSGRATLTSGGPAPSVLVNIHIRVRGTERIISALTDAVGDFSIKWFPLTGEGGRYEIGASHPGLAAAPVQDTFILLGAVVEPQTLAVEFGPSGLIEGAFTLRNLGEVPLTGLTFTAVGAPAGLTFVASLPTGTSLDALATLSVGYDAGVTTGYTGSGSFKLRVGSAEGFTFDLPVRWSAPPLQPLLRASIEALEGAMQVGAQRTLSVTVTNAGNTATGALTIFLPVSPWLSLVSGEQVPSLAPGESTTLNLLLRPPADLPLGEYTGSLVVRGADTATDLVLPLKFRAVTTSTGNLRVTVVDEFTFFGADQRKVAGAQVVLRDPYTLEAIRTGVSSAAGLVAFDGLPSAYYTVEVRADRHATVKQNLFLEPGGTQSVDIFSSYQAVRTTWTVEETDIQDHYKISVNSTFETNVPVPVVVITPEYFDLAALQQPGDRMQVDLKITNHGLIAVNDVEFALPSHPLYTITALTTKVRTLAANSSVTIPVILEYKAAEEPDLPAIKARKSALSPSQASTAKGLSRSTRSATSLPCSLDATLVYFYPCGGQNVGGGISIPFINFFGGGCGGGGLNFRFGDGGGGLYWRGFIGNISSCFSGSGTPIQPDPTTPDPTNPDPEEPEPKGRMLVDLNHDQRIDLASADETKPGKPFRFWTRSTTVEGNEAIDFFPVFLDIKEIVKKYPSGGDTHYTLSQDGGGSLFNKWQLPRDQCFGYLTSKAFEPDDGAIPLLGSGWRLDDDFINYLARNPEMGIIYISAFVPTTQPLVLEVAKAGKSVARVELQLSISDVSQMYRWINLRLANPPPASHPENYPDNMTNGKMFIFTHGYNVDEASARRWSSEVFKRLYQSGGKMMFTGVTWLGDDYQVPVFDKTLAYWANVKHAFRAAEMFSSKVSELPGSQKLVAAHSMGNIMVSSAIVDHHLKVDRYYMLNAAVALEAYDGGAVNFEMLPNDWKDFDSRLRSTNWYTLFSQSDGRSKLTWVDRFGDITEAINFFSSGEEVLSNNPTPGELPWPLGFPWVYQEMAKGTLLSNLISISRQGGWGFNSHWDVPTVIGYDKVGNPIEGSRTRTPAEGESISDEQLTVNPFFTEFDDGRLMTELGGTIARDPETRADILATAIPSLSFAAGRNQIFSFGPARNVDLMTLTAGWPEDRDDRNWKHGDAMDIAYRYNYRLWDMWVYLGGLDK